MALRFNHKDNSIQFTKTATPVTPPSNTVVIYIDSTTGNLTLKDDTGAVQEAGDVANALNSATTIVDVSAAAAPTVDQVLTATSSTTATWQDAGGGGLFTEDADRNIFGGTNAGSNLTAASAFDNFFGGFDAGAAMTTGDRNVMIGKDVGKTLTLGSDNVLIGYDIINDNTSTNLINAVIIGSGAAKYVTGSAHLQGNVIIGKNAGRGQNSSAGGGGDRNVFIGGSSTGAMANWTAGAENTFVGSNSGFALTLGIANTGMGWQALTDITDGDDNVAIGQWAGRNVSIGNKNTIIGSGAAGDKIISGNGNICIGYRAGPAVAGSDQLYIDTAQTDTPLIHGDFTANTVTINGTFGVAKQSTTLGAAATAIAIISNFVVVTGDAGTNTIATITGGLEGQTLVLLFGDALVTITDDNTHVADSVDLSASFTSADDTTLTLIYDGTSWYEISRSVN